MATAEGGEDVGDDEFELPPFTPVGDEPFLQTEVAMAEGGDDEYPPTEVATAEGGDGVGDDESELPPVPPFGDWYPQW